ncbi:MAG TPA: nitrilase-related carbon-nitrogen hydrolase [Thermoplasmata archaeon]|nr:nitrilase-related carbon-nitrogen hydrolase [Thermoplasmata archaeon]
MRIALAELAPHPRDVARNVETLGRVARASAVDLIVAPELYLSGYRVGDAFHSLALDRRELTHSPLVGLARESGKTIVVGAPLRSADRPGEVENAAVLARPDGTVAVQVKRYLPTYGPFEEGALFTPTNTSTPVDVLGQPVGLEICYDVFFPEVSRELALGGAILLVAISAAPVTSRRLFDVVLPARAVENALPVVYVNRVGVEDGFVFGGGSGAWDARGQPVALEPVVVEGLERDESVRVAEIDLTDAPRWRPFRPVLRDTASRPPAGTEIRGPPPPWHSPHPSTRTSGL